MHLEEEQKRDVRAARDEVESELGELDLRGQRGEGERGLEDLRRREQEEEQVEPELGCGADRETRAAPAERLARL